MTILDDAKAVLKLDASATKGPWTGRQPFAGFSAIHGKDDVLVFGLAAGSVEEKRPDAECEANQSLIAEYRTLAPRLAAFVQKVMPLVEAAEEYRGLRAIRDLERAQSLVDATTDAFFVAKARLLRAARALNLEVPKTGSIMDALNAVHRAGGDAWDKVDDPDKAIREMRGYE